MPQTVEDKLRSRFQAAVIKMDTPPPLASPRWLKHYPNGKPADFRFIGAPRIAKAIGKQTDKVVRDLIQTVKIDDLLLEAKVRSNGWIDLMFQSDRRSEKP